MRKRIILADDVPTVRGLLIDLLADEGLAVTAALDARQTIDLVEREPPDLLILNLNMAGIDGLDVVRVLHERELMLFPILVFTATNDSSNVEGGNHAAGNATDLDKVAILAKRLLGDAVHCEPEVPVANSPTT